MHYKQEQPASLRVSVCLVCCCLLLLTLVGSTQAQSRKPYGEYPDQCDEETRHTRSSCSASCGTGKMITDIYCRKGAFWYYREEFVPCNIKPCISPAGRRCVTTPYGPCRRVMTSCVQYMMKQCRGRRGSRRNGVTVRPCNKC